MTEELHLPLISRGHVLIEAPERVDALLVGFHGYAESPVTTLEALGFVKRAGLARWAPRGPHHFYDRRGEVVASWMTRFDRDHQVELQVEYLRSLFAAAAQRYGEIPTFVLGFSQGAATAWRAAVLTGHKIERLFALAGDIPPEVATALADRPPVLSTLIRGRSDAVVEAETLERDASRLREAGWEVESLEVDGGHDYLPEAFEIVTRRIGAA